MPDRLRGGALKKEHDHADSSSHILRNHNTVDDPFSQRVRKQNSIQKDGDRDVRERICHHPKWTGNDTQFNCSRLLFRCHIAGVPAQPRVHARRDERRAYCNKHLADLD